ncbi:MAG: ribulose-phosphate 3-epimerase [Candidatus Kapaibacteriales bacterium]
MKKIYIEPSLLSADFTKLAEQIVQCERAGADFFHLDIMDGHFVPNITFGPIIVSAIRKISRLPLVCHLMIENPDKYIEEFVKSGADYISIHCEANYHINRSLNFLRKFNVKVGLALNPGTPLSYAFENAEYSDFILLMSVNPGFGGQDFIPSFLKRCEELRNFIERNNLSTLIEVDGGIKVSNVHDVVKAGASMIVSGSGIFKGNVEENLRLLREEIKKAYSELQDDCNGIKDTLL